MHTPLLVSKRLFFKFLLNEQGTVNVNKNSKILHSAFLSISDFILSFTLHVPSNNHLTKLKHALI